MVNEAIKQTVGDTLCAVRRPSELSDVLRAFLEIFRCDSDEVFCEEIEVYRDENKLVLRHKNDLYFRGESMAEYLSGKVNREISIKALSKDLAAKSLLMASGGEYSARLPKDMKGKKKLKSVRLYKIKVSALIDLLKAVFPFLELCSSPLKELHPGGNH